MARFPGRPRWLASCIKGINGQPLPILANVLAALRQDPNLVSCFAFDEMLRSALLVSALPGKDLTMTRLVSDNDVGVLQEYLQRRGLPRIGEGIVHQAVDMVARENTFHPICDYLNSLEWDRKTRLSHWLSTYLGAEFSEYTDTIGRMFLIAMVARVMDPGCKCDYAIILEGPQGAGKSSACQILGGDHYSDSLPDVTSGKDVSQHLNGKWLIEFAEMSALSRAEAAALKAFLTRQEERYRPSYGRKEVIEPRQCVFIGTTNKTAYLKDETGNRRFWPVKVGKVEADALRQDRDQLFAEALLLYRGGIRWWPDAEFESCVICPQQAARFEVDIWDEPIAAFLTGRDRVLVGEVARIGLGMTNARTGRADQNRIVAILERRGWTRQPKNSQGNIPWSPTKTG